MLQHVFYSPQSSGVAETLLIEFAHFGRLIKEKPNRKTQDAFEYLKLDRRNEEISTHDQAIPKLSDETEISDKRQRKGLFFIPLRGSLTDKMFCFMYADTLYM